MGAVAGLVRGDFSALPTAGIKLRVMVAFFAWVAFFERVAKPHPNRLPTAMASHPATAGRIRFFNDCVQRVKSVCAGRPGRLSCVTTGAQRLNTRPRRTTSSRGARRRNASIGERACSNTKSALQPTPSP